MENPNIDGLQAEYIYITDVKKHCIRLFPSEMQSKAIYVNHRVTANNSLLNFTQGYERLKYGLAKLVITECIHCAFIV